MGTSLSADITRRNTIEFSNLDEDSYLLTITTREWTFPPSRVDVNTSSINAEGKKEARVDVWQTFWGNEWANKGEYRGGGAVDLSKQSNNDDGENSVVTVEAKPTGKKEYYTERAGFSPLQFLRSPMILMAVFSLALIVGLPYLMDNSMLPSSQPLLRQSELTVTTVDEDTRAEFEEMQKQGITGRGGASNPADSIQNFDLAGWMAGKTTGSNTAESEPEGRRRK